MKKNIIAILLASVCGFSATAANAADGTITFTGNITDTTCDVALTGGTTDLVVQLGAFVKSKVVNASDVLSEHDVTFNLTNCPTAYTKVGVKMEGTADTVMTDAFGNQTPGGATGMAVKLLDGANVISPDTVTALKDITSGAAQLQYKAQFIATQAAVTAGEFNSVINYTMNYQ
ncbi:fimbrial protein [Citrobacter sp. Cpo071]|uniref:fimbrial protein n=1 Tax=Citrobacter sp. Cpo071 TaxID=2985133 RepID=UPI002574F9AE|nr:fimbrial protein [Citrobacter sp. Cpo071]MDM2857135.1 type 1 fimbrial protein [Citrobacter sp. Cpo071]MDM2857230.1 type 1 fimbrial protein [Citrobacter sp. Cpo071]